MKQISIFAFFIVFSLTSCTSTKVRNIKLDALTSEEKILVGEIRIFHVLPPTFKVSNRLRVEYDLKDPSTSNNLETFYMLPWEIDEKELKLHETKIKNRYPGYDVILDSVNRESLIVNNEKVDLSLYLSVSNKLSSGISGSNSFETPITINLRPLDVPKGKLVNLGVLSIIVKVHGKNKIIGGERLSYSSTYEVNKDIKGANAFKTQYRTLFEDYKDDFILISK